MSTLYEINENLKTLLDEAQDFDESTDSELSDKWLADFSEAQGELEEKLDAIMSVRQKALYEEKMYKAEAQRLIDKSKKSSKLADKMHSMVDWFMNNNDKSEIKTPHFEAKYKKNPPKLILDEDFDYDGLIESFKELEEQYNEQKVLISDFKKDTKQRLKNGENIQGAFLEQSKRLDIK